MIQPEDSLSFLLREILAEVQLPCATGIVIDVWARPLHFAEQRTLELLCLLTERWPTAVDKCNGVTYSHEQLVERARRRQPILT